MRAQLVERLVVERSHKLRLCRRAVGVGDVESPGLALSGHESVAEGGPLYVEMRVGLRALNALGVLISLAVLHPSHGERDAVAPLFLIGDGACAHFVAQIGSAVLYHLVAGDECVDNVLDAVGRSQLYEDRRRLALELARRNVEPVVCLYRRAAVLQRECDERLRKSVRSAVSHDAVAHRSERLSVYLHLRVCLASVAVVVYIICNIAVDGFAGVVQISELKGAQVVGECLFGHVAGEQCRAVAVRESRFCALSLARNVCNASLNVESEIAVRVFVVLLGHHNGHLHRESSVARGLRHAAVDCLRASACRSATPEERRTAHNLHLHLCALHRHTGKALCLGSEAHGVAGCITRRSLLYLYAERGALVFLDGEVVVLHIAVVAAQRVGAVQSVLRQNEVG